MFDNKECANGTEQGCYLTPGTGISEEEQNEWLEETVWKGLRMWHVIFLAIGAVLSFVILLCCCFKFRIPRTKQEIEGDYIRRKIMRKFRKRLKAIQNQELDEMDLKKALDKIRTELKSDTESLQQSDVLSGATFSSTGGNLGAGGTYRRASQIQIDISLEDLRIQSMGLGARIAMAFTRFFGRSKKQQSGESDEENGGNGMNDSGTTALLPPKKQGVGEDATKKKKDKDGEKAKGSTTADTQKEGGTTSKEKPSKGEVKGEEKNKKGKKKESATGSTPAVASTSQTTILTTERETGIGDKKQDKKSKKEDNKEKKEKEQHKSKKKEIGEESTATSSKKPMEKTQKTNTNTSTDKKKDNSSQQKK